MLNLNPPVFKNSGFINPSLDCKMLRCQNTGDCFVMDKSDWELAKHCHWFWINGCPVNKQGIRFEDYVGILGERRLGHVETINFCRNAYEPVNPDDKCPSIKIL